MRFAKVSHALSGAVRALLGMFCWVGVATSSFAQEFPSRQVTLLVGFVAGSATDSVARLVTQYLGEKFKTPILVDNKPGAGALIAVQVLKKSAPDGYTLMLGTGGTLVQNPGVQKNISYDPVADFVPVVAVGKAGGILAVRNSLAVSNVKELVEYLKKNPGKATYGSAGVAAAGHLNGEYFVHHTGTSMVHVPYKGANQVAVDLIAGRLDFVITNVSSVLPFVLNGKVKALAVTSQTRLRTAPDIPTLAETGFPGLEGLDPFTFYGIVGPVGMPSAAVARVNQASNEMLKNPEFLAKLASLDFDAVAPNSPADFGRFLASQLAVWRELGSRIKIDIQ